MKKIWKIIYENYTVSNLGDVGSYLIPGSHGPNKKHRMIPVLLTPYIDTYGYLQVKLYIDGVAQNRYVHDLVLEAFVGFCPKGKEGRHLDGNPGGNRLDNLEWATHKVNMSDKEKHGTSLEGNANHQAIDIPSMIVKEILERHSKGESGRSIAKDFEGISGELVRKIINGTHWSQR